MAHQQLSSRAWLPPTSHLPIPRSSGRNVRSARPDFSNSPSARNAAVSRSATFRRLLVPVDGTPFGERALPLAASIARRARAELRLVHVDAPLESLYYPDLSSYYRGDYRRQKYLERLSHNVAEAAGIEVLTECLVRQDIADGICEAASQGVDLVIAATHRYGWLASAWYGATFPRLLEQLATPMLVVPADSQQAALADRWLRRMLVSLDGSAQAEHVMTTATKLGSLYDASYSLLRVVRNECVDGVGVAAFDLDGPARTSDAARQDLRRAALSLEHHTTGAECHVVETDAPAPDVIASHADEYLMDCIVLASGKHSQPKRSLYPSVSRRLIRLSPVPVLVIPDKAKEGVYGHAE